MHVSEHAAVLEKRCLSYPAVISQFFGSLAELQIRILAMTNPLFLMLHGKDATNWGATDAFSAFQPSNHSIFNR